MAKLTPNQVVAANLRTARLLHGLTQEQAAERLAPYLGERWSRVVFSAAERSVTGQRIRNFDADEVAAFAAAFKLPVGFFYLPPRRVQEVGDVDEVAPDEASESLSRDEMAKLATDDVAARVAELRKRYDERLDAMGFTVDSPETDR